ncbi:helix-turn-helix domain-containing protein [Thauera butanivorans]|uniref:helix-turn-helix domain-containing protein n=1 Tax=Thauera butanivorans TaxID=86174 RepID=UPI000A04F24A|nr:helix-turn-helix transcriptional regulator [Thauera butanivorans]
MTKTPYESTGSPNRNCSDSKDATVPIPGKESEQFKDRLREAIGERTLLRFAQECGFSDSLLGAYLRGSKQPGLENLVAMANVGGVTVDWLATGRPPRTRADLAAQQSQGQGQARPAPDGAFDGRRAMLEAVLRVAEHRIEQGAVDADTIAAGLAGAPAWLDAARGYPDLTVRLLSMAATLEFLKAAGAPAPIPATRRGGSA